MDIDESVALPQSKSFPLIPEHLPDGSVCGANLVYFPVKCEDG